MTKRHLIVLVEAANPAYPPWVTTAEALGGSLARLGWTFRMVQPDRYAYEPPDPKAADDRQYEELCEATPLLLRTPQPEHIVEALLEAVRDGPWRFRQFAGTQMWFGPNALLDEFAKEEA